MNEIVFSEGFIDDMTSVYSERVSNAIFNAIDILPFVLVLGSSDLPESIIARFGNDVRKMVVSPFLVLYKILDTNDFLIPALMHERQAW